MVDQPPDEEIERAAAEWLARLNGTAVSTELLEDFYAWRRVPAHGEAFARIEYLWDRSADLYADRDIAFAVRDALGRRQRRRLLPAWLTSRRSLLAGGVTAAAMAGLGWAWWPLRYETGIGERRSLTLDDGSRIELNTDSAVAVNLSADARQIRLERGEAWFEVAHDKSRPFSVEAGGVIATALGTSFSVRRLGEVDRIILAEGALSVASHGDGPARRLDAGHQIDVRGGIAGPAVAAPLDTALSWRSGKIDFRDTPLAAAVAEVNRYSRRQVRFVAPALATVPVTGIFETGDIDSFIQAVTAVFPLAASRADDGAILLVPRRDATA